MRRKIGRLVTASKDIYSCEFQNKYFGVNSIAWIG